MKDITGGLTDHNIGRCIAVDYAGVKGDCVQLQGDCRFFLWLRGESLTHNKTRNCAVDSQIVEKDLLKRQSDFAGSI